MRVEELELSLGQAETERDEGLKNFDTVKKELDTAMSKLEVCLCYANLKD